MGSFLPGNVHKQFGVAFTTPPFTNQNIDRIITTQLYLYKPSDGEYSEPIDFFYEPKMELKTQIKIESAPSPLEQKVPSLMPVYPAPPKPQIKRTRDQRRQPGQQESTQGSQNFFHIFFCQFKFSLFQKSNPNILEVEAML